MKIYCMCDCCGAFERAENTEKTHGYLTLPDGWDTFNDGSCTEGHDLCGHCVTKVYTEVKKQVRNAN